MKSRFLWEVERDFSGWVQPGKKADEEKEAPPEGRSSLRTEERPERYGLRSCSKLRDCCAIVSGNKIRW